jgi:hypothetical protein
MTLRLRIPLVIVTAMLILASCTKTNKQGKFIPKNAAVVLHVDGASLNSKLPWEEVKQNALFKEMYADSAVPAFVKKTLDNPESTGIDIKNDLLIFTVKDSMGSYSALVGTVKDAEKFKSFILEAVKGGSETDKDETRFISKAPSCAGWNKEHFVYIMNEENSYMPNMGTTVKGRDLLGTCAAIFDLKESNSLAQNEKFTALLKQQGDLHIWVNSGELYKTGNSSTSPLAMLSLGKMYDGNITAGTINFDNGKISFDAKSYVSKELSDLYKQYGGKNIDEDMIKALPSKDVAALFAMSFKPEGIKGLLQLFGVEGFANIGLSRMGVDFTLDDFIKANKGDILLAVTDLKQKVYTNNTSPLHGPAALSVQPDVLFAASIADKNAFNLLIRAGEKLTAPMKIDSMQASMLDKFSYNSNDKYFALGNSKENVAAYIAGSSKNNFDFLSQLKGNPFGGYVNIQFVLKAFSANFTADSSAKAVYDASLKMWDNIYIKGGKFEDGGITQNWEINLMDKNTNSLKQLNQYMGLVGKLKMEEHKKMQLNDTMMEEFRDNAIPPPPPPPSNK